MDRHTKLLNEFSRSKSQAEFLNKMQKARKAVEANANGLDLSAKIFESIAAKKLSPTHKARNAIVREFQLSIR